MSAFYVAVNYSISTSDDGPGEDKRRLWGMLAPAILPFHC